MRNWLLGTVISTLALVGTGYSQGFYDHEDPEIVAKVPSLGSVVGINRPNAFVIMKPKTTQGLKVGETVAIRRNDLIVILGRIEDVVNNKEVTIGLYKFNPDGNPARIPRFHDEIIYYPLRVTSVADVSG